MKNLYCFAIGAFLGLWALSCEKPQTLEPPQSEAVSDFLSYPRVTAIAEDSTGHVWVGTSYGLNRAMPYGYHQFFAGSDSLSLQNNHITALFADSAGRLWVAGKGGSLSYLTEEAHFRQVALPYHDKVRMSFLETASGEVLCNDEIGIYRFEPMSQAMLPLIDGPRRNLGFFLWGDDTILLVYPDRLSLYSLTDGQPQSEVLLGGNCRSAALDPEGCLWLSYGGRIDFLPPGSRMLRAAPSALSRAVGDRRIQQIVEGDDGTVLVVLEDDILYYTLSSGQIQTPRERGFSLDTQLFGINCVFCDSQDNLWIGTDGGGLQVLHNIRKWTRFQILLEHFRKTPVSAIEYKDSTLCITDHRGQRYAYALAEKVVRPLPALHTSEETLPFPSRSLHLADGGVLSVGDNSSVIVAMADTDLGYIIPLERLQEALGTRQFLPTALFQDSRGRVWMGTKSSGVALLDLKTSEITALPGVSGKGISSILEDLDGNVWVATKNGLYEYDLQGTPMNRFSRSGREGENAYMDNSYCLLPDGIILLGTMRGINIVNPHQVPKGQLFYLEDLRVNDAIVQPGEDAPIGRSMIYAPEIRLRHDQNNFGILFTELNYGRPNDGSYSYQLEGFNDFWIPCGNAHEAYFSHVPPGNYVFRARISNSGGVPYGGAECRVIISPSPWATPLAKTLYVLLGLGLAALVLSLSLRHVRTRENIRRIELEKQQEQHMNEIIKKYFANVAHQLRTPLTLIWGPVETLYSSAKLPQEERTLLRLVRNNSRRMLTLVNQIMNLHALESDALPMKVSRCDISPVIENTLELYRYLAREKGVRLETEGLDRNVVVYADTEKIVNILDNLLSNAFKYTPEGGRVSVSLSSDGKEAALTVRNSGPAIPDDKLDAIFQRFYQVDSSAKGRVNWGSGIGLYYARRLAQLHHGTLICRNEADGVGFFLHFPVTKESFSAAELYDGPTKMAPRLSTPAPEQPDMPQEEADSDLRKPPVLVVDDDLEISLYLKTVLSPVFRVRTCYDAESALKVLEETAPELIISDIMMSGLSGLDFCARLKGDLQYCHIPVILLTAKDRIEDQIEGLKTGADAYVTKPFHADYLLSLAKNLLEGRRRLQRHLSENAGHAQESELSAQDRSFLEDLYAVWDEHLSDTEFNIAASVERLHMSHTKFIYKVKGLTGFTPSELFLTYKLNKAAAMLREGKYNISEVADLTGFGTLAHFSRVFKKKFGVPPSEYKA